MVRGDREGLRDRCVRAIGERGEGGEKEAKLIGLMPYPVLCRHFRATLCLTTRDQRRIKMRIKMSLSFCHFVTNKHFLILNDRDLYYCNSLL